VSELQLKRLHLNGFGPTSGDDIILEDEAGGVYRVSRKLLEAVCRSDTHIAKVEIIVAGNDEPNRVAALVVDKLNKMSPHRGAQ
jgi:hypothetical protein